MPNIFTVTVVNASPPRSRCWGFFFKFEDAEKSVLNNWTDMFECGYYDYAVIEEFEEGICSIALPEKSKWYRSVYDGKKQTTTPCKCPKQFRQTCNWGLG
jgi:hypothetical protein